MKKISIILLAFFTLNVSADIPNTYTAGDSLTAASLNENFDALQTEVDANTAAINATHHMTRVLQSDGSLLGYVIGGVLGGNGALNVINENRYIVEITSSTESGGAFFNNGSDTFWYESNDCTGQAYIERWEQPGLTKQMGFLLKTTSTFPTSGSPWYYVPINEAAVELTLNSYAGESCTESTHSGRRVAVYPNDSNVTGFSGLSTPLSIKFPFEN